MDHVSQHGLRSALLAVMVMDDTIYNNILTCLVWHDDTLFFFFGWFPTTLTMRIITTERIPRYNMRSSQK